MDPSYKRFLIDYTLGGVAGAVAKTLTAPLARIKTLMQLQDLDPKIRSGEVPRYEGIIDCANRIYEEEGVMALWDGNLIACLRYFLTQAFNLYFKDKFKRMFPRYNPKIEFAKFFGANLVSGGLAAGGSLAIVYPFDLWHSYRIILGSRCEGATDFLQRLVSNDGVGALWTGFGVSLAGIFGYRAIQLSAFDAITGLNPWSADEGLPGAVSKFLAAQAAISFGALVTYPFDTVRRRLQVEVLKPVKERAYNGTLDCFRKIMGEEGVFGYFKGFEVNIFTSFTGALVLVLYGKARKNLGV